MKQKSKTPLYSLIQTLYWANYCLMFNFAALYLLDSGFSNSRIGVILGLSYALSAVCQPVFASIFNRRRLCLSSVIACIFSFNALLALSVLLVRGGGLLLDRFGVHRALTLLQIPSVAGAVLLTLAVPDWKKRGLSGRDV